MNNFHKYLPLSQTEKDWNFYITTAGYSQIHPQESYPPQKGHPPTHSFTWDKGRILNGYYLVFISRGRGVFESALTTPRVITEGTCFVLFPNVWHRYKPNLKTGWEEYWVGFNGPYPNEIMNKQFFNPINPFIKTGLNENLLILFHRLLKAIQDSSPGYHQIISGITLEILGLVYSISIYKEPGDDLNRQLIHKSMFMIRESLEAPLDIHQLIRELPMGYSKFRKLFKLETGYSPNQYHLTLRVNKAIELLKTTELNVREIAFQSGFESEFYFSRLFKDRLGMTPTAFRRQKSSNSQNTNL